MKNILHIFLFLLLSALLSAQGGVIGGNGVIRGNGKIGVGAVATPIFVQSTYVVISSSTLSSITSPAITVGATDTIFVFCRTSTHSTDVATSSPSNTFTPLTGQLNATGGSGNAGEQLSYTQNPTPGSTTFTCTPTAAASYQSMIVLDYTGVGTFQTQAGAIPNSTLTFTSPSFSTGSAGLIVLCAAQNNGGANWTAGSIGGAGATLRQGSKALPTSSSSDAMCEDVITSGPQSSI